jgi:hypothetical protein
VKIIDLIGKSRPLPKTGVMSGNLLKAARSLQPGQGFRLETRGGEEYVMLRAEDFEYICERAGIRAKERAQ